MTPNQIITMARTQFGEDTALTVSDASFQAWLNAALKEAYNDLPAEAMRRTVINSALAFVDGVATLPSEWDRIHEATFGGSTLPKVDPDSIAIIDSNPFLAPNIPVYALVGDQVVVRPKSVLEVRIVHQEAPADIVFPGGGGDELATVDRRWHPALAHLVTSYAYQQEEDHEAAAHWRDRYAAQVGQAAPPPPAQPLQE